MTDKYFQAECQKCGWDLVVPVADKSEYDYYLCQTCAFSKVGAQQWINVDFVDYAVQSYLQLMQIILANTAENGKTVY